MIGHDPTRPSRGDAYRAVLVECAEASFKSKHAIRPDSVKRLRGQIQIADYAAFKLVDTQAECRAGVRFANSIWMRLVWASAFAAGGVRRFRFALALCCRILERASDSFGLRVSRPTSGRAASDLAHPCFSTSIRGKAFRRDPSGTHAGRYGVRRQVAVSV